MGTGTATGDGMGLAAGCGRTGRLAGAAVGEAGDRSKKAWETLGDRLTLRTPWARLRSRIRCSSAVKGTGTDQFSTFSMVTFRSPEVTVPTRQAAKPDSLASAMARPASVSGTNQTMPTPMLNTRYIS